MSFANPIPHHLHHVRRRQHRDDLLGHRFLDGYRRQRAMLAGLRARLPVCDRPVVAVCFPLLDRVAGDQSLSVLCEQQAT